MKKALTQNTTRRVRPRTTLRVRVVSGLALIGLLAGLGLFAARPAHTAGGPIAVNVANAPLLTTLTEPAAPTQPFQYLFQTVDNGPRTSQSIVVPAHKRLVIEYISASLNEYPSSIGGGVYLETVAGGQDVTYYLTDSIQDFAKRNQSLRIYADPGTTVTVGAYSSDFTTGPIGTDTEVSGYYVNVP